MGVTDAADGEIVRRVLGGEVEAYGLLVTKYRPRLSRFALRMLGNREDAEEALQDAFVRAYRSLASCDDPARFGAWLYRILVNRCRTRGLRVRRREAIFLGDEAALEAASTPHPAAARATTAEIERALAALPGEQREAFVLKHVEDLSYDEMAELTGAGVSALKMRVKRACERMRQVLQEAGDA